MDNIVKKYRALKIDDPDIMVEGQLIKYIDHEDCCGYAIVEDNIRIEPCRCESSGKVSQWRLTNGGIDPVIVVRETIGEFNEYVGWYEGDIVYRKSYNIRGVITKDEVGDWYIEWDRNHDFYKSYRDEWSFVNVINKLDRFSIIGNIHQDKKLSKFNYGG